MSDMHEPQVTNGMPSSRNRSSFLLQDRRYEAVAVKREVS